MSKILLVVLTFCLVQCKAAQSPFDLVSEYTKTHHPLQRPVADPNSVLNVTVSFNILHIEDLDETKQQLTTTGWFYFIWKVEGLVWDKTKYQNISRVNTFPKDMYLPDLVLMNAVDNYGKLGGSELPVTVWSDGTVEWYAADLRTTSCKVDVTRFPFDQQRCFINMSQWFTFSSEVNYIFHKPPVTFIGFKESGEWEILDVSALLDYAYNGTYQILTFELFLGRRHSYYILTAVLPACILSVLNLLVFHVPAGSGEKLTLCVSILLSYSVYLTSINSLLPSVSDHVALFSVYLNCMFLLKALTVAASVYVLYLQFATHEPISFPVSISWLLPKKREDGNLPGNPTDTSPPQNDVTPNSFKDPERQRNEFIKNIDRVLFYVFLAVFIVTTIGFFAACVA